MHARSITVHGDPQRIDEAIAFTRDEAMPAATGTQGCVGLSLMCDRGSGRCIATSAWESEEAMLAGAEALRPLRERFAELLGGAMQVQMWEIAAMHRVRPAGAGACTRVVWSHGEDAGQVERVLETWKTTVPSQLEQGEGFCSVSLLVDRAAARAVSAVTYADRDALDRSRAAAQALRDQFTAAMPVQVDEVAEFELALAHLRVPEMA